MFYTINFLTTGGIMEKVFIVGIVLVLCYCIYQVIRSRKVVVTEYFVESSKIPKQFDGFKIVQISDLHNNNITNNIVDKIEEIKPDIIVLTGDVINYDTKTEDYKHIFDIIGKLNKQYPIYYIKGNHEQIIGYYDKFNNNNDNIYLIFEELLIDLGVTILNNRKVHLERKGEVIFLYGLNIPLIQYINFEHTRKVEEFTVEDINKLIKNVNKFEYNILLAHNPFFFEEYEKVGFDLVISGHVHGGEIRLPFIGGLISPRRRLFAKYSKGKFNKNNTSMIVSAGLGDKTFKFRFNNPYDLPVIILKEK